MNNGFTQEELLQCYPPTKEQFLNSWAIIENVKELQKWIERDITAAAINHEPVMVRVLTHHNIKLKKILSTTYHSKSFGGNS